MEIISGSLRQNPRRLALCTHCSVRIFEADNLVWLHIGTNDKHCLSPVLAEPNIATIREETGIEVYF